MRFYEDNFFKNMFSRAHQSPLWKVSKKKSLLFEVKNNLWLLFLFNKLRASVDVIKIFAMHLSDRKQSSAIICPFPFTRYTISRAMAQIS